MNKLDSIKQAALAYQKDAPAMTEDILNLVALVRQSQNTLEGLVDQWGFVNVKYREEVTNTLAAILEFDHNPT